MRLDEIRAAVGETLQGDLDALFDRWQAGGNAEGDLDAFIAWLHSERHIDDRTFRELHAGGSLVLQSFRTVASRTVHPDLTEEEEEEEVEAIDDLPEEPTEEAPLPRVVEPLAPHPPIDTSDEGEGRFSLLGKLAEGAMGEVYIARDELLQRKVALKRMSDRVASSDNLSARFYAEAQITAQLAHPNIVPVYSLEPDVHGGMAYAMKLVNGRTFTEIIDEARRCWEAGGPPPEDIDLEARLEWFLKVCDALSYAHSRGVVHRDLKPDNIMVGAFGEVFVMDWGIARLGTGETPAEELPQLSGAEAPRRTRLGTVIGTPAYMSPEQAEGNNDLVDGRSDQFALGLMLHELVCLKKAFSGDDTIQLLLKVQQGHTDPMRPVTRRQPVPRELVAIAKKATALDPEQRYPSVRALGDDVRRYLRGDPVEARPDALLRRFYRWIGRHRELALMAVLALCMLTAATVIGALLLNQRVMRVAEAREARLSQVLGVTSTQAHRVDARLLEVQGLLKVLAANAVEVLARDPDEIGPEGDSYFLGEPFSPPDLTPSRRYDRDVSIGWPVIKVADRRTAGAAQLPYVRQVTLLRQPFRRLLLSSDSEEAVGAAQDEERALLLDAGTPIAWAYVALENGVFAHYPGHQGFPPGHDARDEDWYERVEGARGPRWGNPHVDIGGLGLMLPCSMGLYDDDGVMLGVAGIDLTFQYLLDSLLEPPELGVPVEIYVLDRDGRVVISSEDRERVVASRTVGRRQVRMKMYAHREILDDLASRPSGVSDVGGGSERRLVVWSRMDSIGWTYVIEGDARGLLAR